MQLSFELSRDDYERFWMHSLRHPKVIGQIFFVWIVLYAFAMVSLLSKSPGWDQIQQEASSRLLWTGILTAGLMAWFLCFSWRQYPLFNGPGGKFQMEVGPRGFVITRDDFDSYEIGLDRLRFVSQSHDHVFLYFGNRDGMPIPKSAFASLEQADQFYQVIRRFKDSNLPKIMERMFDKD